MEFYLRDMRQDEAPQLKRLAQKHFSTLEAIFIEQPHQGLVLMSGDKIAGATFLKKIPLKSGSAIGYIEVIFVLPEFRGMGAAPMLYKAGRDRLRADGCDTVTAVVNDENFQSKRNCEKVGMHESSLAAIAKRYGFAAAFKMYFVLIGAIGMATGAFLLADLPKDKPESTLGWIIKIILLNALAVGGFRLLYGSPINDVALFVLASLALIAVCFIGNVLGALFAGGKWRLGMPSCGSFLAFFMGAMRGFFPWFGRPYPVEYSNTDECRRRLGVAGLTEWVTLLAAIAVSIIFMGAVPFCRQVVEYGMILMVFHAIPVYPFCFYANKRVREWNMPLYYVMLALTVAILVWIFI